MNRHAIFAIFLVVGLFALNWFNNSDPDTIAAITFTDIDQNPHSFAQYKGKPMLIIFWSTDCPSCITEIPDLIELHETYAKQGLVMIAVALAHDTPPHIKAMRSERQIPYTITWDKDASIALAFGNVRVTPTHFLIDPDGEIVMRKIGTLNATRIHDMLQNMGFKES